MSKKSLLDGRKLLPYILIYVIILCFSLYEYYSRYYLLESGLVLQEALIVSLLCLITTVFFFLLKSKPGTKKWYANKWKNYLNAFLLAGIFIALVCFLLVGCIAFINSDVGPQCRIVLNATFIDAKRETGRGGMNEQYYYKFYQSDSINSDRNYVLRSPRKIYFEKNVQLELTKGCLGILYKK